MSVSEKIKFGTHAVLKWEDIRKYLSEEQRTQLRQIWATIADGRSQDGKVRENRYYICNQDEPYSSDVLLAILKGEDEKQCPKKDNDKVVCQHYIVMPDNHFCQLPINKNCPCMKN